jgi:hypothetical protein
LEPNEQGLKREERTSILMLGLLASAIAGRPFANGVYVFYVSLGVLIDWFLVPPWVAYAVFMVLYFRDDLFGPRARHVFHFLGLVSLNVQMIFVVLVFGVVPLALYPPNSIAPYLIDIFVVGLAVAMLFTLKAILRAEWFNKPVAANRCYFPE